jgi:hypothetical protein
MAGSKAATGVVDDHHHPNRAARQALRAEVRVFRGFVGDPEFRAIDGEAGDYGAALGVHAKDLGGAEGGLVDVDGLSAAAD